MMEIVLVLIVTVAAVVYGVFLFAGNEFCYRLLAGGDSFLALDPSEEELKRSARQSAVAVWLIVLALWCVVARACAPLGEALDAAVFIVEIVAGIAIVVIVVLQMKQYADLQKKRYGR